MPKHKNSSSDQMCYSVAAALNNEPSKVFQLTYLKSRGTKKNNLDAIRIQQTPPLIDYKAE